MLPSAPDSDTRLGGVEGAGTKGAEARPGSWEGRVGDGGKRLGRGRWVGRAQRCSLVAQGPLLTLPSPSRHLLAACSLLVETEQPRFHQLSGSTSIHCSHEDVGARCAVQLAYFPASLG